MTPFNFGVEWDAETSLTEAADQERERARLEAEKVRDGRRLTPTQKRDMAYNDMAEAVTEEDLPKIKELLAANPRLTFDVGALDKLRTALTTNFDPELMKMFSDRGLMLDRDEVRATLLKREDLHLLEYFVGTLNSKNPHYNQQLHTETLRAFNPDLSDGRRSMFRKYRARIEQEQPGLFATTMANGYIAPRVVGVYSSSLPQHEKDALGTLDHLDWTKLFTHMVSQMGSSQLPAKYLTSLMDFLRDFPFAQSGWNKAVEQSRKDNAAFHAFVDTYIPDHGPFSETPFVRVVKRHHKKDMYGGDSPLSPPELAGRATTMLNLSPREAVLLHADRFGHMNLQPNPEPPPFTEFPRYVAPSIVHKFVATASPAVYALLNTDEGKALYTRCLEELPVFHRWCKAVPSELLTATVRACPQWKDWTDRHGNTLAHYLVSLRTESSKSFIQLLARLNHNWLLAENETGVSVKDLFEKYGASTDALATLDNESIKRSIKDAGLSKTKRDKTAPTPRRRM